MLVRFAEGAAAGEAIREHVVDGGSALSLI
jgi:hypothetical protein